MPVPTEAEWGDYEVDLDQKYAHKMFAGRANQEMLPHFRRNVIERTDELRWMPVAPFRYYMLGFRDFVMAGEFDPTWAADAASCLYCGSSKNSPDTSWRSFLSFFLLFGTSQRIRHPLGRAKASTGVFKRN